MKRLLSVLTLLCACTASAADRPNILYIALEDITPMMGCYGDTYAKTPNFDQLAAESVRYTHAYSVGPVCSVSRSSIVTGMYPTTIGTMHHRSGGVQAPEFFKFIPNLMGEAGYYTTNQKGDFNIVGMVYDKQGKKNWRNGKSWEIDASGAFHKGPAFSNYFEQRDRVAEREPDFARGFTEALIAYALGRPFAFTDEDLAKEILTVAKSKEHSVSEFVQALVLSEAFKWKKG